VAVDPDASALEAFGTSGPEGPFVMLSLLRFAPGGRAAYEEYSRRAAAFLTRYGDEPPHAGDGAPPLVAGGGQAWDAVLLVRYPGPEAFRSMIADPGYRELTALRTALSEAVRQPTAAWPSRPEPRPS
jgi:uncharacterized protein (DUF1330 family)